MTKHWPPSSWSSDVLLVMSMFKFSMLICVPIDGTSVFPIPKNKSIVGMVLIEHSLLYDRLNGQSCYKHKVSKFWPNRLMVRFTVFLPRLLNFYWSNLPVKWLSFLLSARAYHEHSIMLLLKKKIHSLSFLVKVLANLTGKKF